MSLDILKCPHFSQYICSWVQEDKMGQNYATKSSIKSKCHRTLNIVEMNLQKKSENK